MEFTHLGVKHEFVAFFVNESDARSVGEDIKTWFRKNKFTNMKATSNSAGSTVTFKQPAEVEIMTFAAGGNPMVSVEISVGPDNKWSPKKLDNFAMQFKLTWC